MKAKVYITLKNGVLDPQGKATHAALANLGFADVAGVRIGKYVELDLGNTSADQAQEKVKHMCEALLANTVVENYRIEVVAA